MSQPQNRYTQILQAIFLRHYQPGVTELAFDRTEIGQVAAELGIEPPKNVGDLLSSFRYRSTMPDLIRETAPEGYEWIIRSRGRAQYRLVLARKVSISPTAHLAEIKIPDATPGVITRYALSDEQALLAKVRYNRLVDIFTGLTCNSLQNHLRTAVRGIGQVETDEVYVGLDKHGAHYVLPVQAKGRADRVGVVQIEQDLAMCAAKFPTLICRPIAAQFVEEVHGDRIAMFELADTEEGIRVAAERHYLLVAASELTAEELQAYRRRAAEP